MEKQIQKRFPALDMIRIFALFCVISIHFFLHSGYYSIPVAGGRMYIATVMRTAFRVCVPLFLMLSGYLMNRKKASREYYFKLTRIIGEYVLASICCMVYYALRAGGHPWDMVQAFLR